MAYLRNATCDLRVPAIAGFRAQGELGHLLFGHTKADVSPAEIQRQEEAADQFAVDLLARSGTIPMGMILWFQATAGFRKNRSDFSSDSAYFEWVSSEASHPVNGRRMQT